MEVLSFIPAMWRCGDIQGQNMKLINNKPLIFYSINSAKHCKSIDHIVVISNNDEIIEVSKGYGVDTIKAQGDFLTDFKGADKLIYSYVKQIERKNNKKYDIVMKLNPAYPLLRPETLEEAIKLFINSDDNKCIGVVKTEGIFFEKNNYDMKQSKSGYMQTESFFMAKRNFIDEPCLKKDSIMLYEISSKEAVEINGLEDFLICENRLKRKQIVYRVDGHKKIGMGHIYRSLTLAYQLAGHDIIFVTKKAYSEGIKKIKESGLSYKLIADDNDFFEFLKDCKPDIVINDCLNTTFEYISSVKKYAKRVISIEDLGTGIVAADAVINSLYENVHTGFNIYSGEKYICLREEFIAASPVKIMEKAKNVLVMFGGTDPSNLTEKVYKLAADVYKDNKDIKFTFLSPVGIDPEKQKLYSSPNIEVVKHTKRVTNYMKDADIAFTSQGRTIFELASMGIPSIVMAQNQREQLHMFAGMKNGFLNLGLGSDTSYRAIKSAFNLLVNNYSIRKNMHDLMLLHDLKRGIHRVKNIILGDD